MAVPLIYLLTLDLSHISLSLSFFICKMMKIIFNSQSCFKYSKYNEYESVLLISENTDYVCCV